MKSAAFSEQWLEARLTTLLPEFPEVSLCVALSGGVDSVTLLAALAACARKPSIAGRLRRTPPSRAASERSASSAARRLRASSLRAIHVHHGLHPNANAWAAYCSSLAGKLGVPLQVIKVRVPRPRGASLEASARDARYAALAGALRPGEVLLTGHHQDDQLETVFLQLLRGAGVAGLAAMPDVVPFAGGRLARPLLTRSRVDLEDWARAHDLAWIDDDTNTDERFDRNYLRRTVLPLVRERWPGAGAAVSRAARHAAEARRLLDAVARADVERASVGASLSAQTLRALDADRRRNALRFWITRAGFTVPDTRRLDELAGPLLDARADANPQVRWNDTRVERHADVLSIREGGPARAPLAASADASLDEPASGAPASAAWAAPGAESSAAQTWHWRKSRKLQLTAPRAGTLTLERDRHGPLDLDALPEVLSVRGRSGGESLRTGPGARTRKLKALLQEAKVPLAERESLPLLYAAGKLIAVGDRWLDASVHAGSRTRRRARLRFAVR
ncbi:MAG: tRNA lysidine(34) synthetase TilS [Gammaproteobacteria bacterium]